MSQTNMKLSSALRDVTNQVAKLNSSTSSSTSTTSSSCFKYAELSSSNVINELDGSFELSCRPKRLKPESSSLAADSPLRPQSDSPVQATTSSSDSSDESDVSISWGNSSITFQSSSAASTRRRRLFSNESTSKQPKTPLSSLVILPPCSAEPLPELSESAEEYSIRAIQSCLSMEQRHHVIKQSLEHEHHSAAADDQRRLIGDKSRHHALPTLTAHSTKHTDLSSISPGTLKALLDGEFAHSVARYVIFDSRYPYEFEAGHIRGAQNVYTKEELVEWCFGRQSQVAAATSGQPLVIIFHCEFSSERGPSMLRFLRSHDRAMNKDVYPHLFYPELYLLDGGYKNFFEKHADYCEPRAYKPMLHADHAQDLKHFRAKTKTWETSNKGGLVAHHNGQHSSAVKLETRFKKPSKLHRCPRSTLF